MKTTCILYIYYVGYEALWHSLLAPSGNLAGFSPNVGGCVLVLLLACRLSDSRGFNEITILLVHSYAYHPPEQLTLRLKKKMKKSRAFCALGFFPSFLYHL